MAVIDQVVPVAGAVVAAAVMLRQLVRRVPPRVSVDVTTDKLTLHVSAESKRDGHTPAQSGPETPDAATD